MADNNTANNILVRTAPQNIEAEKSVIGSMLMDKEAIETALGMLTKEDFYSRQYGIMFEAIRSCYESLDKDGIVDIVTVQEQLAKDGAPSEMQSVDFLKALYDASPTSVNIRSYAEIVRDKSVQRKLIKTLLWLGGAAIAAITVYVAWQLVELLH